MRITSKSTPTVVSMWLRKRWGLNGKKVYFQQTDESVAGRS